MKMSSSRSNSYLLPTFTRTTINSSKTPFLNLPSHAAPPTSLSFHSGTSSNTKQTLKTTPRHVNANKAISSGFNLLPQQLIIPSVSNSRTVILGAVSVGLLVFLMGFDPEKAEAFWPEGPLVEEFWDNVRRYALYALTVSTGAIYTILLPIFELLKNPISAVLLIVILGTGFVLVSQTLSAMVGISDFSYEYQY